MPARPSRSQARTATKMDSSMESISGKMFDILHVCCTSFLGLVLEVFGYLLAGKTEEAASPAPGWCRRRPMWRQQ